VASALHQRGLLERLITDAWVGPSNPLGAMKRSLRERYHAGLREAQVSAANLSLMAFELEARARQLNGWRRTMARNDWFQRRAVRALAGLGAGPRTVFAYSYAALEILRFARAKGWRTVLGQIDPGPWEERIVARLYEANPAQRGLWKPAPAEYWRRWREECELADCVAVNSEWSARALAEEGIAREKIHIVPLAYEYPREASAFRRVYPERFTQERPLRALFLGQVNLRKGVSELLEAVGLLEGEPVEFWFAGGRQVAIRPEIQADPRVKWFGQVPRGEAARYYREADVFVFPTHSDGFGLTQLEAQAWRLPVIASRACAEVVEDGRNGVVLGAVTPLEIAEALRACVREPARLAQMAANAVQQETCSLDRVGQRLLEAAAGAASAPIVNLQAS
jgi:glycosyltransferase involved in cell wall biosynthesis